MLMREALTGNRIRLQEKALKSDVKRAKLVAIAFRKNGSFITSAINQIFRGNKNKFSVHAEEALIKKLKKLRARERYGPITVLVMRWSKGYGWKIAKPCASCERQLRDYGIVSVLFTSNDGSIKEL